MQLQSIYDNSTIEVRKTPGELAGRAPKTGTGWYLSELFRLYDDKPFVTLEFEMCVPKRTKRNFPKEVKALGFRPVDEGFDRSDETEWGDEGLYRYSCRKRVTTHTLAELKREMKTVEAFIKKLYKAKKAHPVYVS